MYRIYALLILLVFLFIWALTTWAEATVEQIKERQNEAGYDICMELQ
jgi:hypothetical protein